MGSISFPAEEERILKQWEESDAFHRQLELTKDLPPYDFRDGPPFATGTPHYGHLLAGTIKVSFIALPRAHDTCNHAHLHLSYSLTNCSFASRKLSLAINDMIQR